MSPYTSQRLEENVQSFIQSRILPRESVNLAEAIRPVTHCKTVGLTIDAAKLLLLLPSSQEPFEWDANNYHWAQDAHGDRVGNPCALFPTHKALAIQISSLAKDTDMAQNDLEGKHLP